MTTVEPTTGDPVRDALSAATEAIRAANHDRTEPEFPSDVYDRTGNLSDLLRKLDQLTTRLGNEAGQLTETPLTHDDASGDAIDTAARAAADLFEANMAVRRALSFVDRAHGHLSHLGAS